VPKDWTHKLLRKVKASGEVYGKIMGHIDTKEKFEAKRQVLAERVWTYMKGNDSRECRHCHTVAKMDSEKQSEAAQLRHARAKREKLSCIDCHFGIAHTTPVGGPGPQELEVEKSLLSKESIF
jgi:cytochrome c-type protein NapC